METQTMKVSLYPSNIIGKLAEIEGLGDVVHVELIQINETKEVAIAIFEKFYLRAGNYAALTVISNNTDDPSGATTVKAISTGSSSSYFPKIDLGASKDFVKHVVEALEQYRL